MYLKNIASCYFCSCPHRHSPPRDVHDITEKQKQYERRPVHHTQLQFFCSAVHCNTTPCRWFKLANKTCKTYRDVMCLLGEVHQPNLPDKTNIISMPTLYNTIRKYGCTFLTKCAIKNWFPVTHNAPHVERLHCLLTFVLLLPSSKIQN